MRQHLTHLLSLFKKKKEVWAMRIITIEKDGEVVAQATMRVKLNEEHRLDEFENTIKLMMQD